MIFLLVTKKSDQLVKVLFNTQGLSRESRKAGSGGRTDSDTQATKLDNSELKIFKIKHFLISLRLIDF